MGTQTYQSVLGSSGWGCRGWGAGVQPCRVHGWGSPGTRGGTQELDFHSLSEVRVSGCPKEKRKPWFGSRKGELSFP